MCIIVAKPENVKLPTDEIFKNCWDNNPDGAGLMYVKGDLVVIEKGLMTYNAFKGTLNKLKKCLDTTKTPMVFHFRIGTHGAKSPANTHPFPISDDEDLLQKIRLQTRIGVVHNGIIDLAAGTGTTSLSDTQIYIRDYLSILAQNPDFYKQAELLTLIKRMIKSKMTFLTPNKQITNIGDFTKDKGVYYSNEAYLDSYQSYVTKYSKYYRYSYANGYDDWQLDEVSGDVTYIKQLMWLDTESYILKDDEYLPLPNAQFLMDFQGRLYTYDYEKDAAVFHSISTVYDGDLRKVEFDKAVSERLPIIYTKVKGKLEND